jgi:hypothetical protein
MNDKIQPKDINMQRTHNLGLFDGDTTEGIINIIY